MTTEEHESLVEAIEELEDIKAIEDRKDEKTVKFEDVFKGK